MKIKTTITIDRKVFKQVYNLAKTKNKKLGSDLWNVSNTINQLLINALSLPEFMGGEGGENESYKKD